MEYDYRKLAPFKFFILQNFPFIEEDFDAITNYQLLCKLGEEINKIINSVNLIGEQAEALTNAYNALKDYVDNYFENLDVQDEIDNKLDDMSEQGQLAEIIAQYLSVQAVLGFATIAEMSTAEYLVDGAYMRTYGNTALNDGDGGFYFAREIQNTDVVDGYYIVALNDPDLVAVRCSDGRLDTIEGEIATLQGNYEKLVNKKYLLVGDSYLQGYTPTGTVKNWGQVFAEIQDLSQSEYRILANGGAGFANGDNTFYNLLNNDSATDKAQITDVIIMGGYNDRNAISSIPDAIFATASLIRANYTNVKKIYIGMCAGSNIPSDIYKLFQVYRQYWHSAVGANCIYLNGMENTLKIRGQALASDGYHPSENGNYEIGANLSQIINSGSSVVTYLYSPFTLLNGNFQLASYTYNGITQIVNQNKVTLSGSFGSQSANGLDSNWIDLGEPQVQDGILLIGTEYTVNVGSFIATVKANSNSYYDCSASLIIKNHHFYLSLMKINDSHNNYEQLNSIEQIQIQPFSFTVLDVML